MSKKAAPTSVGRPRASSPISRACSRAGLAGPEIPAASKINESSAELRILKAIRQIIRAIELHSRKLQSEHNITGPQLICLMTVAERQPLTQGVLAGEVHLSPSTVIGILDRLEAKGLVKRERDARDRRFIRVTITAEGRRLVKRAPSPLQESFSKALANLPETDLLNLSASLERIVSLMKIQHLDASPILETGPIDASIGDRGASTTNPATREKKGGI